MEFQRYAIFYMPKPGPLATFASAWLGWDPATGSAVEHPVVAGLPMALPEITQTPRKYGFHGTIMPPFRLAEGRGAADLSLQLDAFCTDQAPLALDGLELAQLGRFLALVPVGDDAALKALAAQVVEHLDSFRAPPTPSELARRRTGGLSDVQEQLLSVWGYPYVMQEFRFHLTLTGKLPKAKATKLRQVLESMLASLLPTPFLIDGLCLMGEDRSGMFHLIRRFPFGSR